MTEPTCIHGEAIGTPCAGCAAVSAELQAEFDAAVGAGVYDAEGYKPSERHLKRPRQQTLDFVVDTPESEA